MTRGTNFINLINIVAGEINFKLIFLHVNYSLLNFSYNCANWMDLHASNHVDATTTPVVASVVGGTAFPLEPLSQGSEQCYICLKKNTIENSCTLSADTKLLVALALGCFSNDLVCKLRVCTSCKRKYDGNIYSALKSNILQQKITQPKETSNFAKPTIDLTSPIALVLACWSEFSNKRPYHYCSLYAKLKPEHGFCLLPTPIGYCTNVRCGKYDDMGGECIIVKIVDQNYVKVKKSFVDTRTYDVPIERFNRSSATDPKSITLEYNQHAMKRLSADKNSLAVTLAEQNHTLDSRQKESLTLKLKLEAMSQEITMSKTLALSQQSKV